MSKPIYRISFKVSLHCMVKPSQNRRNRQKHGNNITFITGQTPAHWLPAAELAGLLQPHRYRIIQIPYRIWQVPYTFDVFNLVLVYCTELMSKQIVQNNCLIMFGCCGNATEDIALYYSSCLHVTVLSSANWEIEEANKWKLMLTFSSN